MSACMLYAGTYVLYVHEYDNYEEIPKQIRTNEEPNSEQQRF